jgi:hypothetical protein
MNLPPRVDDDPIFAVANPDIAARDDGEPRAELNFPVRPRFTTD